MKINEIKQKLKDKKKELSDAYSISEIGVFGSYIRGEERSGSDVDVLISFNEEPSLYGFIELENKLSELLEAKVDLVEKSALKPAIGRHILSEVQYI
ncbi:MAG TPA: nucleotidyltransferase family protein [Candidatus Goldiibacteriota bacterium]|nr:nucleotidyltransferase family protein [Candidatus Goldiibacteriota bacterium]HPN64856.1 nucleotidyltransferase family protein [Candidatus Goldiibacteriota bacterium]HRQ43229.1 nucleotidyltransferase family protein [Candidatus Goldiibacteriota bacterium]